MALLDRSAESGLGGARPRLRPDLKITRHDHGGHPSYVVEDPLAHRFYRVGVRELGLIALLDGRTTIREAMRLLAEKGEGEPFEDPEVVRIIAWLDSCHLVETPHLVRSRLPSKPATAVSFERRLTRLIWMRIPLFHPDRFLTRLEPFVRPFLGVGFLAVWFALVLIALLLVGSEWERFLASGRGLLSTGNWIWLLVAWGGLKSLHEMGHGLLTKRYGGTVPEMGVILLFLSPLGYVDASSSWSFRSKWQRIHVALGGMFVEILVASLAVIVWSQAEPGFARSFACDVVFMASVSTVLVNANPLMRFDGYHVLVDLLESPNLGTRSAGYLRYLARRYLLGVGCVFLSRSWSDRVLLVVYGLAAFAYRIVLYVGMIVGAMRLYLGLGLVLAAIAALAWVVLPLLRMVRYLAVGTSHERPGWLRLAVLLGAAASIVVVARPDLQVEPKRVAPAVVVSAEEAVVRAYAPGFVGEVFVETEQAVEAGALLVRLENRQLVDELARLELDLARSELRRDRFEALEELAAAEVERGTIAALRQRRQEKSRQVASLEVRSPVAGIVTTFDLPGLRGRFLPTGGEVARIVPATGRIVRAALAHDELDRLRSALDRPIEIRVAGRPDLAFTGRSISISPRATPEIPHPALTALAGGPLDVTVSATGRPALLTPHFWIEIALPEPWDRRLRPGETVWIRFRSPREPIGSALAREVELWVSKRVNEFLRGD